MRIIFSLAASGVVFFQLIELADERPVDAPTYPLPTAYPGMYVHKMVRRAWGCAR